MSPDWYSEVSKEFSTLRKRSPTLKAALFIEFEAALETACRCSISALPGWFPGTSPEQSGWMSCLQSEGGPAAQPRNEVMLGMRWFEMAAIDCSSELVSISTVSVSAASIRVSTDSVLFVSRIFGWR